MTSKFPSLSSKEVLRLLHEHGFVEVRQRGSHLTLRSSEKGLQVTVPLGRKDLRIGTLRSILISAELMEEIKKEN